MIGAASLTIFGLEGAVRAGYQPPGQLLPKVHEALATLDPQKPDVLVFGTCIGDQSLDRPVLESGLGPAARVHSLTAPGAFPMDWYLTLRTVLDPSLVDLILVVFTPGDLSVPSLTWQSQTYDLMDLTSIREVAAWSCTDRSCETELYLRKFSLLYRNRSYLANRVWTQLGAREGASPVGPSPVNFVPRADAASLAPWHFVGRMIEVAKERGTPLEFVELPLNRAAGSEAEWAQHEHIRRETESRLASLGASVNVLAAPGPEGYEDLVHFTGSGRKTITSEVVADLRTRGRIGK